MTINNLKLKKILIDDIKPYPNNPRVNDEAVKHVAKSIENNGYRNPILVDKNNVIITGHTRLKALKKIGVSGEVLVLDGSDMTEEAAKRYRLEDNTTSEFSTWDVDLLKQEITELGSLDFELKNFTTEELVNEEGVASSVDDVEEDNYDFDKEEVNTNIKLGDKFVLGDHVLLCGDSCEEEYYKKLFSDNTKPDMILTDPPYNVNYGQGHPEDLTKKRKKIANDNLKNEFAPFLKKAFTLQKKYCKPGVISYVFMSTQEWGVFMRELENTGFKWSSTIIWEKDQFVLTRKDYHTKFEALFVAGEDKVVVNVIEEDDDEFFGTYQPIYYGWDDSSKRLHPLKSRKETDIWKIPRPKVSLEHPTMKPLKLLSKALLLSSKKKGVVLDVFGGSGSTLIACEKTGRKCRMMELDPVYCQVIINRYEAVSGNKAFKV